MNIIFQFSAGQEIPEWLHWVVMAQGVSWGCHLYTGLGWSHLKAWMGLEDLLPGCLTYAWRISASCRGSQFLAVWSTFMARRASFLRTGFRREAQAAMCFMSSSHPVTSTISFWLYVLAVYCGGWPHKGVNLGGTFTSPSGSAHDGGRQGGWPTQVLWNSVRYLCWLWFASENGLL